MAIDTTSDSYVYNPIRTVNGNACPVPSAFSYTLSDISESDAGRTEDLIMHKKRAGQAYQIALQWDAPDFATATQILQLFQDEYFTVLFYDIFTGTWRTDTFYAGDRKATMYSCVLGRWESVSLDIIRRYGDELEA